MIGNIVAGTLSAGAPPVAPSSYESIATVTVGSGGSSSIDFTSIPSTYKHLQLRIMANANASNRICIAYNSDTNTSNYNSHYIEGNGSVAFMA
jgi:hypothetical protein